MGLHLINFKLHAESLKPFLYLAYNESYTGANYTAYKKGENIFL